MPKKTFEQKKLKLDGRDVTVDVEEVESEVPTIRAMAVCGKSRVSIPHTLMPVADSRGDPPDVQTLIDALRDKAANEATKREKVREALASAV